MAFRGVSQRSREGSWEKVAYTGGKPFSSFLEFVQASRTENGLGTTKSALLKLIQVPHEREKTEWSERGPALRQAIDELLGKEIKEESDHGGDRRSKKFQVEGPNLKPRPRSSPFICDLCNN